MNLRQVLLHFLEIVVSSWVKATAEMNGISFVLSLSCWMIHSPQYEQLSEFRLKVNYEVDQKLKLKKYMNHISKMIMVPSFSFMTSVLC